VRTGLDGAAERRGALAHPEHAPPRARASGGATRVALVGHDELHRPGGPAHGERGARGPRRVPQHVRQRLLRDAEHRQL